MLNVILILQILIQPLQNYKINQVISSFGAVFRAVQRSTGDIVAIKRMMVEPSTQAEILQEIDFMKQCNSSHIIRYYGHWEHDSDIFVRITY